MRLLKKLVEEGLSVEKKRVILIILLLIYLLFLSPIFQWSQVTEALIMLLITQIIWISQIFNLMVASLIVLFLLAVNFLTFDEAIGFIGMDIVWLLFSTFIIAGAFMKTGLSLRISLYILKLSRGIGSLLLLMAFVMMSIMAFFIPSNAGRMNLVITVITGMLEYLKKMYNIESFGKSMMIGVNYVVPMSGAFIITGTNTSIYAYGIFSEEGSLDWNYISWMQYFIPPAIIFLVMLWLVLLWIFPLPVLDRKKVLFFIKNEIKKRGSFSPEEIKLSIISAMILVLWILDPYHPFSIPMIGLGGALLTVFPYVGVWDWEEAKDSVHWDVLIFFAASLAVAGMLLDSGALEAVAALIVNVQAVIVYDWLLLLIIGIMALLLRIIFLNVLGYMTIMLPLALMLGQEIEGMSSILVAMFIFLIGGPGFLLITQTPVNMLSYRFGYYTKTDLLKAGSIVSILWLIIVLLTSQFYWSTFFL